MKHFLLLWFMLCSFSVYSQEGYRIKSMAECGNDTIEYIKTNFAGHEDRYIGKPFGKFLDDVKLKIYVLGAPIDSSLGMWVLRMSYMRGGDDMLYYFHDIPYYYFYVEFEPPYITNEELWPKYEGNRQLLIGNFFSKCIVKEMKFYYRRREYTDKKGGPYWKGERIN